MQRFIGILSQFYSQASDYLGIPDIQFTVIDAIEIIIIAFLLYHFLVWIKNTRAWNLFKGILFILVFVLIAVIFQMSTILWIAKNALSVALIALVVIFQPELRKALENLGNRNITKHLFGTGREREGRFSKKTLDELIKASFAMGKVKTGALIVIERDITLNEYIRTGIDIDGILTSQLLINIFEKNTPLHDGAVIVRGDRIVSATCYLPLSDSMMLSKDLGTRHRAAVGVSEASDSFTIIVSEETGKVSVAQKGKIYHDVDADTLREMLVKLQERGNGDGSRRRRFLRRRKDGE